MSAATETPLSASVLPLLPSSSRAGKTAPRLSADDLRTARLLEQRHQLDPQDAAYRHLAVAAGVEVAA